MTERCFQWIVLNKLIYGILQINGYNFQYSYNQNLHLLLAEIVFLTGQYFVKKLIMEVR